MSYTTGGVFDLGSIREAMSSAGRLVLESSTIHMWMSLKVAIRGSVVGGDICDMCCM